MMKNIIFKFSLWKMVIYDPITISGFLNYVLTWGYIFVFQVCDTCPNVKYVREGNFINVDIEKGMQDGQVENNCYLFLPVIYL